MIIWRLNWGSTLVSRIRWRSTWCFDGFGCPGVTDTKSPSLKQSFPKMAIMNRKLYVSWDINCAADGISRLLEASEERRSSKQSPSAILEFKPQVIEVLITLLTSIRRWRYFQRFGLPNMLQINRLWLSNSLLKKHSVFEVPFVLAVSRRTSVVMSKSCWPLFTFVSLSSFNSISLCFSSRYDSSAAGCRVVCYNIYCQPLAHSRVFNRPLAGE